jgi:diacylglycerol kinase (ATP)
MDGSSSSMSAFKSRGGVVRIFRAFGYSLSGLVAAFRFESAFRQELALIVVMVALALVAKLSAVEWVLLVLSMGFVLVTELLNSAVEAVVDRVSLERHPLSGRAKDIASAAVLVSMGCLFLTFAILVLPRLAVMLGLLK